MTGAETGWNLLDYGVEERAMHETEAEDILGKRVDEGGQLRVAANMDLPSLKRLRSRCLDAGIPVMLGPCAPGG